MIIYLGFTAGAVYPAAPGEIFNSPDVENFCGDNINASNEEGEDRSSHIEVVNFHKVHKHLAASRTYEVQQKSFTTLVPAIRLSSINAAYKKFAAAITVMPVISQAPIFIKNCILLI